MSDPKNETDILAHQQKPIEQLDAEHANDAPGGSIPVVWKDGYTGQKTSGRPLIAPPNAEEIGELASGRVNTCGLCRFYNLAEGRKQIAKQRIGERLVREEQWKLHHLGDIESLAICDQRPNMMVSYVSKACELIQLRKKR